MRDVVEAGLNEAASTRRSMGVGRGAGGSRRGSAIVALRPPSDWTDAWGAGNRLGSTAMAATVVVIDGVWRRCRRAMGSGGDELLPSATDIAAVDQASTVRRRLGRS